MRDANLDTLEKIFSRPTQNKKTTHTNTPLWEAEMTSIEAPLSSLNSCNKPFDLAYRQTNPALLTGSFSFTSTLMCCPNTNHILSIRGIEIAHSDASYNKEKWTANGFRGSECHQANIHPSIQTYLQINIIVLRKRIHLRNAWSASINQATSNN